MRRRSHAITQEGQQASAIEKSVTHLLVATKQLLETLTQWARGAATENDVSDVYVRLGYEFNIACRAFNGVNIETADLGNVPETLRHILEETLSQEASQTSLDRFLPRIRDIIINLLHGLKRKQQKLRQRSVRESTSSHTRREGSIAGSVGQDTDNRKSQVTRTASNDVFPNRHESLPPGADPRRTASAPRHPSGQLPMSVSDPVMTATGPQQPPPPVAVPDHGEPEAPAADTAPPRPPRPPDNLTPPPVPATAPRKQQDALAALQRGGDLERRASRRFSAYQIQKHLGAPSSSVPMIPPAQRSPIPNRGPEIRESMHAVRQRGAERAKAAPSPIHEQSPERRPQSITNIRDSLRDIPQDGPQTFAPPTDQHELIDSPNAKTPEDKYAAPPPFPGAEEAKATSSPMRATITRLDETFPIPELIEPSPQEPQKAELDLPAITVPPVDTSLAVADKEPSEGRHSRAPEAITLFLQYKTKVKKVILSNGFEELTIPRLQLAFIDKFAWNTHSNGVDLPEIYLQDPVSGVRHELEDMADIKDRSVLVLNVDGVDEVKRHFDDSLGNLKSTVEGIRSAMAEQQSALQRVTESQQDAAKDIARFATMPAPATASRPSMTSAPSGKATARQRQEVETLRRDLAVLKQTMLSARTDMESSLANFRAKAASVKEAAAKATAPSTDGESGRAYINAGKKSLTEDSEKLINRVDDLQDTIEDLRKDIAGRGVRVLPRQLQAVSSDIASATAETRRLRDVLKREKPVWNKIAEQELQSVYDDQETMRVQEELVTDLEDDLDKLSETFTLVEEVTKQQGPANGASRQASRTMPGSRDVDPLKAKDTVLGEVRALQPNHESRLEAIERAERNRLVELDHRQSNAFKKELGNFVQENLFKKTGGVEEVERLRVSKEESARKENFERMAARQMGMEYEPDTALFGKPEEAEDEEEYEEEDDEEDDDYHLEPPSADDDGLTTPESEFVEAETHFPMPGGAAT